ncbi:MAG TPA: plasma-membrane proton-efflux P-type ATPase [Gammaproteobacteria bacterium]|nr:plasma-membrane proton-efflux P-type ATPase [Gammaproteobacteria bacterium]
MRRNTHNGQRKVASDNGEAQEEQGVSGGVENQSIDELFRELESGKEGLSEEEAKQRLERYGANVLEEKRVNPLLKFFGYFWGPIAWMIEIAAALSAVIGHWADLGIILVLLLFNAAVGFWEEYQAGNAVEQLKKSLALKARILRDGTWREVDAKELVPGDIVRLHLGAIVPADIKLFDGDYLSVDQSALTGESLPVDKTVGDVAYSSSVATQGTMLGLVVATGMDTFFGRTAQLVSAASHVSHFQKAVMTIGRYLIYTSLVLVAVLIGEEIYRAAPVFQVVEYALILTVASIPVAMPAVLSVTMAVGALALSKMKAIVSRLDSIEEMAGIDVLCSDKTGTLTQNELTLGEPASFNGATVQEAILAAALASPTDDRDAIDLAVVKGLRDESALGRYSQKQFTPFDPVSKRTEAEIVDPEGASFRVSKGAPQVILDLAEPDARLRQEVEAKVEEFARQGNRTLGVARCADGKRWAFLGLLPLFDPPRDDAKEVITQAEQHGVTVKMVTGDNIAIGKQIAAILGLGSNILAADALVESAQEGEVDAASVRKIGEADGFAQVAPEHKYAIVKALQKENHLVGMTGDGVNDAPALSQADVGIAVSGATDAARSAADLVLTAPGLSVIIRAIEEARRIFERMNSYAIYRITETIRIMVFVVLTIMLYNFYPITTVLIILLALLNDLPIMTIAYDNTWLSPVPARWDMRRVLMVASTLGLIGVIETFGLLVIAMHFFDLSRAQLQSLVFLKLVVAGHLTLMVARTRRRFFRPPYPAPVLLGAVLGTQVVAAVIVGFGLFVDRIPWLYVGVVWAYALGWILLEDEAKIIVYRYLERGAPEMHPQRDAQEGGSDGADAQNARHGQRARGR